MTPDNEITTEVNATQGGKIIFAPDVIATLQALRLQKSKAWWAWPAASSKALPEC